MTIYCHLVNLKNRITILKTIQQLVLKLNYMHLLFMIHQIASKFDLLSIYDGGAGAGKSHTIASFAEWVQYLLQKSGDDINCPYVMKTSFTGAAASLIQGMTLHSAFGFEFGNKHYSLSDRTRDARRNILKNLKMIIIDEISMVKADMLYQLDLRLQESKKG